MTRMAVILCVVVATAAEAREWKDATGKFGTEAEFVRMEGDAVVLKKTDGSEVAVPLSKLRKEDQEHARSRSEIIGQLDAARRSAIADLEKSIKEARIAVARGNKAAGRQIGLMKKQIAAIKSGRFAQTLDVRTAKKGTIGIPGHVDATGGLKVLSIIDEKAMLVEGWYREIIPAIVGIRHGPLRRTEPIMIRGVATVGLKDDDKWTTKDLFICDGTTQYQTVLGGRKTVLVFRRFPPIRLGRLRD